MMTGIIGGLMFAGLILGAVTGCIWYMLGFVAAGLLIAGIAEATKAVREQAAASYRLNHYPPYGY